MSTPSESWNVIPPGRVAAPLRDQVLNVIRQAIMNFELKPGQRLIERELVEQLAVSRTTIREVLTVLVSDGLVTVIPQKGAIVSVITTDEARDIYEIRSSLEALAVARFTERASADEILLLRQSFHELKQATDDGESKLDLLRSKDNFYGVLLAGARFPSLTQILTMLQGRVRVLRLTSLSAPGRSKETVEEIGRIVALVEARDGNGAAEAMAAHVRNAAQAGLTKIAEREKIRLVGEES
ncbi:MAG TPA: GntR family transcriptional regulator [Candidatus Nanopelagicaceae bacterium]